MSSQKVTRQGDGDECDRFDDFYKATVQGVFDTVRRAAGGDKYLAEESTQNAYVELVRRWEERSRWSLQQNRRYVIGIAMHKLADHYRQVGRFNVLDDEYPNEQGHASHDGTLDESGLLQSVRDFLNRQKPRQRQVGVLFFIEDYTYSEIAEVLGVTSSTVRTQVQRLREQLRSLAKSAVSHGDGEGGGSL